MPGTKTIANMVVKMTALSKPFDDGIKKSTSLVKSFGATVKTVSPTLHQFGGALVNPVKGLGMMTSGLGKLTGALFNMKSLLLVIAGTAIASFVKKTLETSDVLVKLSERTATSIDNIVGLRLASSEAGFDLEKIPFVLDKMNRAVGETRAGMGKALPAFERLRISVKDFEGKDTVDIFGLIGDRMRMLETVADRAAVAIRIFGAGNLDLLNTLNLGSEGIKNYIQQAKELGLTFDDVAGQQIARANDAMTRIQLLFQGISRQLVIQLTPFIIKASEAFTDMGRSGGGVGVKVFKLFEDGTVTLARFIDKLNFMKKGFLSLGLVGVNVLQAIVAILQTVSNFVGVIGVGLVAGFKLAFAKIVEVATGGVNGIINALNKIPGVTIGQIDNSAYQAKLKESAKDAVNLFNSTFENGVKDITGTLNFFEGIEKDLKKKIMSIDKAKSHESRALEYIRKIQADVRKDAENLLATRQKSAQFAENSERIDLGSFGQGRFSSLVGNVGGMFDSAGNRLDIKSATEEQTGVLKEIRDLMQQNNGVAFT